MDQELSNHNRIRSLTENTLIPLGVVFLLLSAVSWFSIDRTEVRAAVNTNSEKIRQTEAQVEKQSEKLELLLQDVAVIRQTVQRIDRKISR